LRPLRLLFFRALAFPTALFFFRWKRLFCSEGRVLHRGSGKLAQFQFLMPPPARLSALGKTSFLVFTTSCFGAPRHAFWMFPIPPELPVLLFFSKYFFLGNGVVRLCFSPRGTESPFPCGSALQVSLTSRRLFPGFGPTSTAALPEYTPHLSLVAVFSCPAD